MIISNKYCNCPFCNSISKLKNVENFYDIFRCTKCNLLFVNPIPEKKKNEEIIQYWGDNNIENSIANKRKYNKVNQFFIKILFKYFVNNKTQPRILDIGCGYGFFVKLLNENNFDAYGLDISKQSTYFAKNNLNLKNIFTSDLSNEVFSDNFFNSIIALNLLEHVPDPEGLLQIIHKKLKKNGIFLLRVPNMSFHYNFKFIIKRLLKRKYSLIATTPPIHLFGYSLKNLNQILEKNKFKIIESGPSKLGLSKKKNVFKNFYITVFNIFFKSIFIFSNKKINISPSIYIVCKKL
tara:strand:- start:6038 stop:6916 length:879 start_codon:yes stop_codon:yes gene_type:complete